MSYKYPNIVRASVESVFSVAEALATDIPGGAYGDVSTSLAEAIAEAEEAGGDTKSVSTWGKWRLAALYVLDEETGNFEWVPRVGVILHYRASTAGIDVDTLRANPNAVADRDSEIEAAKKAFDQKIRDEASARKAERDAVERVKAEARTAEWQARKAERDATEAARLVAQLANGPSPLRVVAPSFVEEVEAARAARPTVVREALRPVTAEELDPIACAVEAYLSASRKAIALYFHLDDPDAVKALLAAHATIADEIESGEIASTRAAIEASTAARRAYR